MKNLFKNITAARLILIITTVLAITVLGVCFKIPIYSIIPLYVSVAVYFLQADVNRYAFLLGSINSLLYGVIYIAVFKYYAMAFNAFLVSAPLQFFTFLRWKKNAYKKSTVLKKKSVKTKIITALIMAVSFAVFEIVLIFLKSQNTVFDNLATILGIAVTVLQLLAFKEYTWLNLVSNISTVMLYIAGIVKGDYNQLPYLAFSIYALICIVMSLINCQKIYNEQQLVKESTK